MKKILMMVTGLLVGVGLCAADKPQEGSESALGLSLETSVKFQTDYAYRGRRELRKAMLPNIRVGYPAFAGGTVYAGAEAAVGIDDAAWGNRIAPYIGITYDATDIFKLDAGYTHNFHTSLRTNNIVGADKFPTGYRRNTSEFYAGVVADVLMTPSLYIFYDVGRKEFALEGKVGYTFDLSQYAVQGLSVDLGAKLGYDTARRPYGAVYQSVLHGKKSYFYYGVSADIVYGITSNAKAKIGVYYEGNSAKRPPDVTWVYSSYEKTGYHKNIVWFNASIDCSF
ncbi:MAG: hypothetical protein LBB18_00820 [Puniceicoccales bacterium]|jgi:hypothetical protein|nr:hypothetical protein [Puniceicoccales bacterium]